MILTFCSAIPVSAIFFKKSLENRYRILYNNVYGTVSFMIAYGEHVLNNIDYEMYLYRQGTNYYSQNFLGAHRFDGHYIFRTWAPNAYRVSLCGDFNGWDKYRNLMEKIDDSGVWQTSVDDSEFKDCCNSAYKYCITGANGEHMKADPYAVYSETLNNTASLLYESKYDWNDSEYLRKRERVFRRFGNEMRFPVTIYEVHLGSWKAKHGVSDSDGKSYLTYREMAQTLVPYLKEMHYTHVEFLPVMEHPYDGSWGYQVTSFFAPTSRFGTPDDFRLLIDTLHKEGIGVILDWVPAHFPKDEAGMYEYDGGPLYEYHGADRMEHKVWNTRFFDLGRNEVQEFLISNALYWVEEFHADGLRFDAVAAMLYLDFDRKPGEWIPNCYGENINLEAVAFLKKINAVIKNKHPDVITIAEESTHYDAVTKPIAEGGLGFDLKWNMGWSNDMFDFVQTDPMWRGKEYTKLNFSFMYCFDQKYVLPVSHDEVCHGKKSLIDKMFGSTDDKFDMLRLFLCYQAAHPGKKMLFMGCEYGQFREWDYSGQLEWFMLEYTNHCEVRKFTAALNEFYIKHRQLWYDDFSWNGTKMLQADDRENCVIAFERVAEEERALLCVFNFSGNDIEDYVLNVPDDGTYTVCFSSRFHKRNRYNAHNNNLKITLPRLTALYLICPETIKKE